MKQKYLVYTLFGLLAVNMSWNLGTSKESGQVHLASTSASTFDYDDENGKRITFEQGQVSSRTYINSKGEEVTKETVTLTVTKTEGSACECLLNTQISAEVTVENDKIKISGLAAVIARAEEDAKKAEQERKDKAEIAATEAKAKAQENRACKLEGRDERMDCHAERLSELSDDIKSQGCRTSTDRECEKLIEQYEAHKEAIVGYVDELIAESQDEDKKLARRANTKLKSLSRSSSSVVKKTVNALLNTDKNFSQTEDMYHRIPELMRASLAMSSTNPMLSMQYGQEAYRLEQQLKYMVQNSDVSGYLNRQLDNNYNGGLGEDHVSYFMDRNSALRKALNIQAIYPTQLNAQSLGNNSSIVPQSINFRGNGFSGSSGVPGNSSRVFANAGELNLSQLSQNSSVLTTSSPSTLVTPSRIQSRN